MGPDMMAASSRLLTIPYRALNYKPREQNDTDLDFSDSELVERYTWLDFGSGVSWTPQRLEVNGRKGRRVACVVAEDRFHYRVYDLDTRDRAQEVEGEDGMSDTDG